MPKRLTAIKIPAVSQSAAVRQLQRAVLQPQLQRAVLQPQLQRAVLQPQLQRAVLRPQPQRAVLQLQHAASQLAARRPDAVVCVCRVSAAAPPRKRKVAAPKPHC